MKKNSIIIILLTISLSSFAQKGILGLVDELEKFKFGSTKSEVVKLIEKRISYDGNMFSDDDLTLDYFKFDGEPYEFAEFYFCEKRLYNILFMRTFNEKYEALSIFYRLASIIDKRYSELPPPSLEDGAAIGYDGFFAGNYNTKSWAKPNSAIRFRLTLMARMLDTSDPLNGIHYTLPECDYTLHIRYTDTSLDKGCSGE